jgi:hypothetical protein
LERLAPLAVPVRSQIVLPCAAPGRQDHYFVAYGVRLIGRGSAWRIAGFQSVYVRFGSSATRRYASGSRGMSASPRKRTNSRCVVRSASCQQQTFASQQIVLFDHLVGGGEQAGRTVNPSALLFSPMIVCSSPLRLRIFCSDALGYSTIACVLAAENPK